MFAYNQNVSHKPPVSLRVAEKIPPNLTLVGEQKLAHPTGQADVIDYHGPLYQHSLTVQELSKKKSNATDNAAIVLEHYKDRIDAINTPLPAQTSFRVPAPPNSRQDGRVSRGGFFHPPSRASDYEGLNQYGETSPQSRSTSVAQIIATSLSRPNSAISRPNSAISRPTSAVSRPTSAVGRHSSLMRDMPDFDPDHEPISDVLSRLGDYTQNFVPDLPQAYTDCECKETTHISSKHSNTNVHSSDGEEESSSDDEAYGVGLDVLLKTIQLYEDKGPSALRHKAIMTLLDGYICNQPVASPDLNKIVKYLSSQVPDVQETCLMLLRKLVSIPSNVQALLEARILDFINSCLNTQEMWPLRRLALLLLEGICLCSIHKDSWFEEATDRYLPKLLSLVRGECPLDVKYAASCVFRALALFEEFIVTVTEDILPAVLNLRNASAKFKEVYVEILTRLLSHTHCIPPDLLDSSAIPITASIIREGPCGPQCAALHLLTSVTTADAGVAMVIGTNTLVTMVLCCMKESHCKRVRVNATEVMRHLCSCRKMGLCKDLMLQLSSYMVPTPDPSSLSTLSNVTVPNVFPAKPRFDEDRYMWQGLEKFIDLIKTVIFKEAIVKTDDDGLVTKVHLQPCVNVNPGQLTLLTHAFHVLQSTCLWPLDKSRLGFSANRVNLAMFTDDDKQRFRLSKINRGLTQAIWDKVGIVVTDLLAAYAGKFHKVCEESSKGDNLFHSLDSVFESEEIQLIESLMEILLCSSLCTCVAFPEILPKYEDPKGKRRSKTGSKLKSSSTSRIMSQEGKNSSQVESKLKSQSDVGHGFNGEQDGLWVKDNPHLTTALPPSGTGSALEKSRADISHKEACTERRLLRKCLYETGAVHCLGPLLSCSDTHIQVLVLQILRCLVQPLEERVVPKSSFTSMGSTGKGAHQRPQTAGPTRDSSRKLNIALYKMSPDLAGLIKEALGDHDDEEPNTITTIPRASPSPSTAQQRLQEFTESQKETDCQNPEVKPAEQESRMLQKLKIDRCRPIAQQCREAMLEGVGERLLRGIFSRDPVVKKQCVLLLHDVVQFGETGTHMELSKQGCMPKLVDFLRVNGTNELLEVMGLITVRLLVGSDPRLKQLFNRHGGPQLLLAMAQYTTGLIKQEVSTTLRTVTKVETTKKRPMSAPAARATTPSKAPDIWDHIVGRWQQEDQVTRVLRQWIEADKPSRRKVSWK